MNRTTPRPLLALLAAALLGAVACGEAVPGESPEAQELAEARLTMDDVRRFAGARAALAELTATDSSAWRALRPLSAELEPHGSMEEAARALELHPGIRRTLSDADLSPEAYVRTRFALQQALLAHDLRQQGGEESPLPAAVPAENVELVAAHRDEIERLLIGNVPADTGATADTAGGG